MTAYRALIEQTAAALAIDPNVIEAIVLKESEDDPWAYRSEPQYRYLWNVRTHAPFRPLTHAEIASEDPPLDFPTLAGTRTQEWWAQQASWGLMQIMGAVAREHGFTGAYLTRLVDPTVNLTIGGQVLASLLVWSGGDLRQTFAAYNGGRGGWKKPDPQHYATSVLAKLRVIEQEHTS